MGHILGEDRNMTLPRLAFVVACGFLAAGCPETTQPTPPGGTRIEPISIDSVDVAILESAPPQAVAHVTGVIGDGCSELNGVEQKRDGNTVTVTITRTRPVDAICTQIAKLYDANIHLNGAFPAGNYVVKVNGVTKAFATQ
jgi:acetolactate synthase regulatory subunit